jgi:hypothetical protein
MAIVLDHTIVPAHDYGVSSSATVSETLQRRRKRVC